MSLASIVKVENGQVKTYNSSGSGLNQFGTGTGSQQAVSAIIRGDEIHVTRADGKVVICTHSGSGKRIV
jgi:hypothetical protein